jgi:polysaccharide export outer membrane protein
MYPLEIRATALTAISMAGGFSKFGSASRVKVLRMNESSGAYDTMKVNINEIMSGNSRADVLLKSGDIVVVSESLF